jgi:hypothetical protein
LVVVVPAVWVAVEQGSARACRSVDPVAFSTTRHSRSAAS